MPRSVVSAGSGPASNAPSFVALSAAGIPSLQIKIFMARLQFVTSHECVNNDSGADQRQGHEGDSDLQNGKIVTQKRADRTAGRSAGVHHQRNKNVDVAFDRVAEGSIAG